MATEEKIRYEVIQSRTGQIFIIRGGWKSSGNKVTDVYALSPVPSKDGSIALTITRLDQATLLSESDGVVRIKEHLIDMCYYLKDDASITARLKAVDDMANAQKAGIVLQPNEGVIR